MDDLSILAFEVKVERIRQQIRQLTPGSPIDRVSLRTTRLIANEHSSSIIIALFVDWWQAKVQQVAGNGLVTDAVLSEYDGLGYLMCGIKYAHTDLGGKNIGPCILVRKRKRGKSFDLYLDDLEAEGLKLITLMTPGIPESGGE